MLNRQMVNSRVHFYLHNLHIEAVLPRPAYIHQKTDMSTWSPLTEGSHKSIGNGQEVGYNEAHSQDGNLQTDYFLVGN